jgi:hypothetical protein
MNLHFYNSSAAFLASAVYLVMAGPVGVTHSTDNVPGGCLLASVCLQHLGSCISYVVIGMVSELSYTVLNTLKRVAIIVFSIWIFGYEINLQTALGISSAVAGIVLYNVANYRSKKEKRRLSNDQDSSSCGDGAREEVLPFTV